MVLTIQSYKPRQVAAMVSRPVHFAGANRLPESDRLELSRKTAPPEGWGTRIARWGTYAIGLSGAAVFAKPALIIAERLMLVGVEFWPVTLAGLALGGGYGAYRYMTQPKGTKELTPEEQKKMLGDLLEKLEGRRKEKTQLLQEMQADVTRETGELNGYKQKLAEMEVEAAAAGENKTHQQILDLDFQERRIEHQQKTVDMLQRQASSAEEVADVIEAQIKELAFRYEMAQKNIERLEMMHRGTKMVDLNEALNQAAHGEGGLNLDELRQQYEESRKEQEDVLAEAAAMHSLLESDTNDIEGNRRIASMVRRHRESKVLRPHADEGEPSALDKALADAEKAGEVTKTDAVGKKRP